MGFRKSHEHSIGFPGLLGAFRGFRYVLEILLGHQGLSGAFQWFSRAFRGVPRVQIRFRDTPETSWALRSILGGFQEFQRRSGGLNALQRYSCGLQGVSGAFQGLQGLSGAFRGVQMHSRDISGGFKESQERSIFKSFQERSGELQVVSGTS